MDGVVRLGVLQPVARRRRRLFAFPRRRVAAIDLLGARPAAGTPPKAVRVVRRAA